MCRFRRTVHFYLYFYFTLFFSSASGPSNIGNQLREYISALCNRQYTQNCRNRFMSTRGNLGFNISGYRPFSCFPQPRSLSSSKSLSTVSLSLSDELRQYHYHSAYCVQNTRVFYVLRMLLNNCRTASALCDTSASVIFDVHDIFSTVRWITLQTLQAFCHLQSPYFI